MPATVCGHTTWYQRNKGEEVLYLQHIGKESRRLTSADSEAILPVNTRCSSPHLYLWRPQYINAEPDVCRLCSVLFYWHNLLLLGTTKHNAFMNPPSPTHHTNPPPSHTHTYTAPVEVDIIRREYGECLAAYGSLGVLTVNVTTETYHYLVLITGCQSVGKVTNQLCYVPSYLLSVTDTGAAGDRRDCTVQMVLA